MYEPLPIAREIIVAEKTVSTSAPPKGLLVREPLGILTTPAVDGAVVYRTRDGGTLFETRATKTPGGDYLLMFPTNSRNRPTGRSHYGRASEKVNDLVALRSTDGGQNWTGPAIAFDIDYNQHGYIPFTPAGSTRMYAFGTQPVWGMYSNEDGLWENAPIGYRYSDDDGRTWSEVRLIRPGNDPGFLGMSVMRMCETGNGTWILGSHEADHTYRPLMTRQYLLRSEDRGANWEVIPGRRHGGWYARGFNRMDEGRPISLGGSRVAMMARTAEGHLWMSWSDDDGKTWREPEPSPLIHPDAPPMLFHLADGKTLAAFHHTRHHDLAYTGLTAAKREQMGDRSEIWISLSRDDGRTWSEPQFVFANALDPDLELPFFNHQCSYIDAFVDGPTMHLFVPHRWQQVLHLTLDEKEIVALPTKRVFGAR